MRANALGLDYAYLRLDLSAREHRSAAHLAGERMTVADSCLLAVLDPAEAIELELTPYPALHVWREGLKAKPFYLPVHRFFGETMMAAE